MEVTNRSRRILSTKQLQEKLGDKGRSTIWRWVRAGILPAPIILGDNSRGWFEDEVDQKLASRPRVTYAPPVAEPPKVA